ncbi:helix-turn-helix domain-containing protein [Streptomyces thermoalcalitolerans]|uniref:Helix-turn-helix domain-containing protein n=1 Tax=Streptomyces thermoalcalitolerans TaxID=65605 RepID=A0ABN1NMD1_9ACTN
MFKNPRQRSLVLGTASLVIAIGTVYAADAARGAPADTHHSTHGSHRSFGHHSDCGKGGRGGEGGKGGRPGQPGEPGKPGCLRSGDLLPDKPKGAKLQGVDKIRIVMSVMSGHTTRAEAAKKYEVSENEIDTWKRQFLNGDWFTLFGENNGENGENGEDAFPFCS